MYMPAELTPMPSTRGILEAAVQVSSHFLSDGVVLYEKRKDGQERAYPVRGGGVARDLPLVAIVDGGTASGAEIIDLDWMVDIEEAGALYNHYNAEGIPSPARWLATRQPR